MVWISSEKHLKLLKLKMCDFMGAWVTCTGSCLEEKRLRRFPAVRLVRHFPLSLRWEEPSPWSCEAGFLVSLFFHGIRFLRGRQHCWRVPFHHRCDLFSLMWNPGVSGSERGFKGERAVAPGAAWRWDQHWVWCAGGSSGRKGGASCSRGLWAEDTYV